MRTLATMLVIAATLALGGCPATPSACNLVADGVCPPGCPTDPDCVNADVGMPDVPPRPDTNQAALCSRVPSGGNYGPDVGQRVENFTLQQCDGTDFTFYDEGFCSDEHTVTVFSIAAEWCGPCRQESLMLRDRILLPYQDRGVRVVQVIVQNARYREPTLELCNTWVEDHNLQGVTELIDPGGVVSPYFPSGALPSTLVLNRDGAVIFKENGVSEGLATLRAAIDRELTRIGR